jgi:phage gp46-like protein
MILDAQLTEDSAGLYDISIGAGGDINSVESYATAILVSVFTDRRAGDHEMSQPERRRGWAGNDHTPDVEMGSKLWLFEQRRATRAVSDGIANATRAALQWLVEERRAVSVSAVASFTGSTLEMEIEIRYSPSEVDRHHYTLWQNTGV